MTATDQLVVTDGHRRRAEAAFAEVARVIWMTGDSDQAVAIIARALAATAVEAVEQAAWAYCPECGVSAEDHWGHRVGCPLDDEARDACPEDPDGLHFLGCGCE